MRPPLPRAATPGILARLGHVLLCCLVATAVSPWLAGPAYADPVRARQWQLDLLHTSAAWKHANGKNVVVAVLDSGVDADHPDLAGQVLPGVDLVDNSGDGWDDKVGHGTAVSALIAGRDDSGGVVGIAHHAKILPVRVLDRENRYRDAGMVARGLRWAVDHGADVVNMSLGGTQPSAELAEAIQYAYDKDVVVVACAGNAAGDKTEEIWYPAREPGVIAVTGLGTNGKFWKLSLSGPQSVLAAPAADLYGAKPGGYTRLQGTSFSAPMVSAAAALVRARWPDMSAGNVVNRLIRTARDLGKPGRDHKYGFGVVDPLAALTTPVTSVQANPLDTTPPSRDASAGWSRSSSPKAAPGQGDPGQWWAVLIGLFAVAVSAVVAVALLRHARSPAELAE